MPIDFDSVRTAFYGPPLPSPPDHLPTREELLAEHQRICLQANRKPGVNRAARAIGEQGSLIGGPGKPLTFLGRRVEYLLRLEPMPLEWFDYPEARTVWFQPADEDTTVRDRIEFLEEVIAIQLAGYPNRPTAHQFARWILSPASSSPRIGALYNIFETIRPGHCAQMLSRGHFTLFEVARAIILSEARAPELIAWLHQFAVDPEHSSRQ